MSYTDTAYKYCNDVVSGVIPACQLVRSACQRHLSDLERKDFPYRFDKEKAEKRCRFSEKFVHVKGKWTGQPIVLSPHQVFIQACIWGWVHKKTGMRRFNIAYIEEPRKNGKSLDAATTGLYMLVADGEAGAEVYSGASTEKQALEVFRPAWLMAQKKPAFRDHFSISLSGTPKNPTSIYRVNDMSRFELLVGNPGDGASPHCAIIDEYHEHRTSDQYDTMETGMGSREQPLMLVITTAGIDTSSPCYAMHLRAANVLNGTIEDEAFFAIIFTIDPEADWKDFNVWKAANPNYGISINEEYLKRKYTETLNNAEKQNINLCKHLNIWTNAGIAWMNMVKWNACIDTTLRMEDFIGQPCWVGLDLASKVDICAVTMLFKADRGYVVFGKYYLPSERVDEAGNEHYVKWSKEGYITVTEGARTDFKIIEEDLKQINRSYPIIELAFDPRESGYLIANIMEWMRPEKCVEITQGPALMSQPMKELEALVHAQGIWSDGNPVLTWMVGNVVKKQGRAGGPVKYYYPTKEKDESKIDGAVALIMAISRAMMGDGIPSAYNGKSVEEMMERMAL